MNIFFSQWAPEITHHCSKTPFILVGTQIDLRTDNETISRLQKNNEKLVTSKQGERLAQEIKAAKYMECSARTTVNNEFRSIHRFIFSL